MEGKSFRERLLSILHPPDTEVPESEGELETDLILAFNYGLAVGVFKAQYAERLLRLLSVDNYFIERLITHATGKRDVSMEDVGKLNMNDFIDMAALVEKEIG